MTIKPKKAYFDMHVISIDSPELEEAIPKNGNKDEVVVDETATNIINSSQQRNDSQILSIYRYPPFFITFISIFQLVVFVYYSLRADEPISATGPVPFNSKLIYNPHRRYEIWRFLTYGLIHTGYYHMISNLIIQLAVGVPLEIVHKCETVSIIYLGGIISGSLAHSIVDPHSYLAGASSGCYALIASHLSNLIINWRFLENENPKFELASLLLFCFTDIGVAAYERHFKGGTLGWRTSYSAHLAGALSGLLLGFIFLNRSQTHRFELFASRYSRYIFITLITIAILFNISNPSYFPLQDFRELDWATSPFAKYRE